jgi:hypothetical protein
MGAPSLMASTTDLDVGQSVTFSVTIAHGSGSYSYSWKGLPAGCVSGSMPMLVCTPLRAGSPSVSVAVTDGNGVVLSSQSVNMTVFARLAPGTITSTSAVLDIGQGTKLTVTVTGGSGNLSYAWSGLPSGCSSTDAAQLSCTPAALGTFSLTAEVTDGNGGLVWVGPVSLSVFSALGTPTVSSSVSSLQLGGTVIFTAGVSGGSSPLAYSWGGLPSGCISVDSPTLTCVPTAVGTYSVTVTVTDVTGVSLTSSAAQLTVSSVPAQGFASSTNGLEWTVLALAIVAVALGLLGVVLALRRRKSGGAPATTTNSDSVQAKPAEEPRSSPSSRKATPKEEWSEDAEGEGDSKVES